MTMAHKRHKQVGAYAGGGQRAEEYKKELAVASESKERRGGKRRGEEGRGEERRGAKRRGEGRRGDREEKRGEERGGMRREE